MDWIRDRVVELSKHKVVTHVRITNLTDTDIINTECPPLDSFDWVGSHRPDYNLNELYIASGTYKERVIELNSNASHCPFELILFFKDGTKDHFRIHQKYVIDDCIGFIHFHKTHNISYRAVGNRLEIDISDNEEQLNNAKAEKLRLEGENAIQNQQYEKASQLFEKALEFANENKTIEAISESKLRLQNKIDNKTAEKLKQEGELATSQKQYEKAIQKFAEALKLAREDSTKESINRSKDLAERLQKYQIKNQEAEELMQDGDAAFQDKKYDEAIKKYNEALLIANEDTTKNTIKSKKYNAEQFHENETKAETIALQGEEAVRQKQFEEAIKKFEDALNLATKDETISSIKLSKANAEKLLQNKINNEKAEKLIQEGDTHVNLKQYEEAIKKFKEALTFATEDHTINAINTSIETSKEKLQRRIDNDKADHIHKEGKTALEQEQHNEAIQKFDEALILARQDNTINAIKSSKADALNKKGRIVLQEGWSMQTSLDDNIFKITVNKFSAARALFQEAENLMHSVDRLKDLQKIIIKIEGDDLISNGMELEADANKLFQTAESSGDYSNYDVIENKYKEALNKYKLAKEKIEEGVRLDDGDNKFNKCLILLNKRMNKILDNIDRAEINYSNSRRSL